MQTSVVPALFFGACVGLAAVGVAHRNWPVGFDAAVREVADGDADGAHRARLLARICDEGVALAVARDDATSALQAAASALALDDGAAYQRVVDAARAAEFGSSIVAFGLGADSDVATAALGLAAVADLWLGHAAANAGRQGDALRLYRRALAAARLRGLSVLARVVGEHLQSS